MAELQDALYKSTQTLRESELHNAKLQAMLDAKNQENQRLAAARAKAIAELEK